MPKTKQKFILIDGNALVHRAFHALPPLTTKDGELVNAVYGFITIFLRALKDIEPQYVAVTFDRAKKTFRDELYADYKATRVKAPQELYDQIPKIKEVLKLFKVPVYELDGFEADDVIGTICHLKSVDRPDVETMIVTGDLDTLQLVDDNTKVYALKRGISDTIIYDDKAVAQRFDGLKPNQMIDFKALKGDASDNIPGVKGIGEVTAINLLKEFKTLDNIYKNINHKKITDSIRQKLAGFKDDAYLSQKLATIVLDAPVNFSLEDAAVKPYDKTGLVSLFQKYQFNSLLNKLYGADKIGENTTASRAQGTNYGWQNVEQIYKIIKTEKEFTDFLSQLASQKEFVLDTETTGLDTFNLQLLGLSFCWEAGQAFYVPVAQVLGEGLFEEIKLNQTWLNKLKHILEDEQINKIGLNIKYDAQVLLSVEINVTPLIFDPMIADYLLNPGSRNHNLDALSFSEFGYQKISFKELTTRDKKIIPITQVPLEKLGYYSCEDADFTWRLYKLLSEKLESEKLIKLFAEIEMPLVPVLISLEQAGVKIDAAYLKKFSQELEKSLTTLTKKIYKLAGSEFNISSPLQLKKVLFEDLQISTVGIGKTKTGFSTAAEELEKLQGRHAIIDLISEFRELSKLKSTYVAALPQLINKKTGRVHTSFNQTITSTGRLSSSNPNFQNLPIKTELGRRVRQAIIAEKGNKILSADYSQIELRIAASLSGDKNMITAFANDADIHTLTAARINNINPEEVTKELRRSAKEINFGILYGMGANGLAVRTGITHYQAKEFIEKYFEAFPDIQKYLDETKAFARDKGYVQTIFGRKRYLPDIHSGVHNIQAAAERMAINMPIQGTAADLIKMAMIQIHKKLPSVSPKSKMILQVHDELVFEVPEKEIAKVTEFIKKEMESVYQFSCPIKAEVEVGDNWGDIK